jgi:hypothetical protein
MKTICYRVWSKSNNCFDSPSVEETTNFNNGLSYNRLIQGTGVTLELGSGLIDKNRQQIFEGDIIRVRYSDTFLPANAKVEFRNGKFGFVLNCSMESGQWYDLGSFSYRRFEIIGTIHEDLI